MGQSRRRLGRSVEWPDRKIFEAVVAPWIERQLPAAE